MKYIQNYYKENRQFTVCLSWHYTVFLKKSGLSDYTASLYFGRNATAGNWPQDLY